MEKEENIQDLSIKGKLNVKILSGDDLKLYLLMRFGTYNNAARFAGFDESRIFQIASGYQVPQSPDLIKKLAEVWGIDLVVISSLFERLRNGAAKDETNN